MITELRQYGYGHVGYVVDDLEGAVKTLTDFYDVKEWRYVTFRPQRAWVYGQEVEEYTLEIALGVINGTCQVEVIKPGLGGGPCADFLAAGNSGLHHVAFNIDDYDYWKERFAKSGGKFVFESEQTTEQGFRRCLYVQDPLLGCVELLENLQPPR